MAHTNLVNQVYTYIQEHQLIPTGSSVLVGLSGGPDSVFLLHALAHIQKTHNITVYAAHLDHEWRAESHSDMLFCKERAYELGMQFFYARASEIDITTPMRGSWEAHGRLLRRSFFTSLQQQHNIDRIALAHHKDDQRETFFIRMLRGAGLTGLAGIQPQQDGFVHPLLNIEKADIYRYLQDHGIKYLEDPSNVSDMVLRNRIRKYLMPALRECDDRADISLDRTMDNLREADDYLQQHITHIMPDFTHDAEDMTWLHITTLQNAHPYLRRQIFVRWLAHHNAQFTPTAGFFKEVERFLHNAKSKSHQIHPSWGIYKRRGYIRVYHINETQMDAAE